MTSYEDKIGQQEAEAIILEKVAAKNLLEESDGRGSRAAPSGRWSRRIWGDEVLSVHNTDSEPVGA